jgi:tetratricopeptide (TPR) repeat protein
MRTHYEAANRYLNSGDRTNAEIEYKAFVTEALHRLANAEAQVGHFDYAFSLFKEALKFAPADNELQLDFAAASLDAERLPQAKEAAAQVVQRDAHSARARFLLGRILYDSEDYQQAKTQLEAAVALNSDFHTGYLLGKTYLVLHDEKSARVLFDEMVAGLGDTATLHTYFGRAYSLMDFPELALEEFHKAIARDAHARDAHYYLALSYLRHDESTGYAKAIPEFQAELQNNPNDVRSHYMLGYIALKQRNFAEAETELTRASQLQPEDLNTVICLAETYMGEDRAGDAEAFLQKAIKTSSSNPRQQNQISRAHYLLGRLLMKQGRVEEARRQMRMSASGGSNVADSGPAAEPRLISSGSLVQQESGERSGEAAQTHSAEEERSVEELKQQMALAISDGYNNLGALAAMRQDYQAALPLFEASGLWNPKEEGLDRNIGIAAFYAGDYGKALPLLQQYSTAHPGDDVVRGMLEEIQKKRSAGNDGAHN